MRFENRPLAAFSVARNFDRKQTPRSEISQTTRAVVTPGPAEHQNIEAARHFERSRSQKNAAWTSNALVAGLRIDGCRPLLDRQERYDGGTTQALGLLASWSEKSSRFRRNFDRKQTHFARKHFSQPNASSGESLVNGNSQCAARSWPVDAPWWL